MKTAGFSTTMVDVDRPVLYTPLDGRRVTRLNQADHFAAAAGIVAIASALLAVFDATAYQTGDRSAIFHDSPWPTVLPLAVFGLVTAIAWTCSQRAIFRVASLEASTIMASGVTRADISDMLELKTPSRSWLYWRLRMWRSSAYAVLCVLLYVAAALMYRVAFTVRDVVVYSQPSGVTRPLLGCPPTNYGNMVESPPVGLLEGMAWLRDDGRSEFASAEVFSYAFSLGSSSSDLTVGEWRIHQGWSGHGLYLGTQDSHEGYVDNAYLTFVSQDAPPPPDSTEHVTLTVDEHPSCGPTLKFCRIPKDIEFDYLYSGFCKWIGVAPGTFRVSYSSDQLFLPIFFQFSSGTSPTLTPTSDDPSCPLALSRDLSQRAADTFVNLTDSTTTPEVTEKVLPSLLVALLNQNVTAAVPDPAPLHDLGLLARNAPADCGDTENGYAGAKGAPFAGEDWASQSRNFFPTYQFASAGLVAAWGVLLLVAAWPWRGIVVDGGLLGWMRLGADIGRPPAAGGDGVKYRLAIRECGGVRTAMVMLDGVGGWGTGGVEQRPKLQFGWTYI